MDNKKYRFEIGSIITLATAATIALTAWSGPFAAQTASTAIVPFSEFVDSLTVAPADAYVGQPGVEVKSSSAFEAMRRHLVKMYSGVTVTRSIQAGQSSFRLCPDQRSTKCAPTKAKDTTRAATDLADQLMGSGRRKRCTYKRDKNAPDGQRCEDGTIPMRRLTLEELTRFKTLKNYFGTGPHGAGRVAADRCPPTPANNHAHATAQQDVKNYGGRSYLNLWKPYVDPILLQGELISQQWYVGGCGDHLQTVEVGWAVVPSKYGTEDAVLFILATPDNYKTYCFNNDKCGFVQTNNNWYLGYGFTNYSTDGGPQYEVHLGFYLYQGYWWLAAGDDWVGYYLRDFFAGGQLTNFAETIAYGGETSAIATKGSWPPMGSGQFASAGWTHAAYQRAVAYSDENGTLYDPILTLRQPHPECYTITAPTLGGR